MNTNTTFSTQIKSQFDNLVEQLVAKGPDAKDNQGRALSTAYVWDTLTSHAKKASERAWTACDNFLEQVVPKTDCTFDIGSSPHFIATVKVSKPVNRFDPDELAKLLAASKYKVPLHVTKELVAKAKLPSSPTRTYTISERE